MLKNIVFDLDGTLWQTGNSYVYAYHKLCSLHNIQQKVSDEVVKTYLGVRLDKLLCDLFPGVQDKITLAKQAVQFSIDYLLQHPSDCYFEGVGELLQNLSQNYKVFIVSNCPQNYVETFLQISNTKQFVADFYTIEMGEKSQHLSRIAGDVCGKTLFVGDCDDDYTSIENHFEIIFCYARYGYKSCQCYDYKIANPLELLDVVQRISVKERQLSGKPYRVFSCGDNQLTLIHNKNGADYFGFVNYVDQDFVKVIYQLKEFCRGHLIGPIDGNTFYPYRFATDNFDVLFYPDCNNGKQVVELFQTHGFAFKQFYVSTIATVNERMWKLSKKAKLPKGYTVKLVSGTEAFQYLDDIYQLTIDAFAEADYYEEIPKQDFVELYMKNIEDVVPDMTLFFFDNQLVGYNFCYEDPLKRYYVCKTTAIKKEHRNNNLVMLMVDYSYSMLVAKGYKYALHHFQNDTTKTLQGIFRGHEVLQKHYALMEWKREN